MDLSFKEQADFSNIREELFDGDDNFRLFQDALLKNPRAGAVIQGTSGARKVRWSDPARGQGKRGGIRVIYYYHEERRQILLLLAYTKKVADLTPKQRREISAAIQAFRREVEQATPPE